LRWRPASGGCTAEPACIIARQEFEKRGSDGEENRGAEGLFFVVFLLFFFFIVGQIAVRSLLRVFFFVILIIIVVIRNGIHLDGMSLGDLELFFTLGTVENLAFFHFVFVDVKFGGAIRTANHGCFLLVRWLPPGGPAGDG
jgi:hypothetical protein